MKRLLSLTLAAALLAVDLGVQWLLLRRREVKF